jgi:vancomycin resistance protein YoaR
MTTLTALASTRTLLAPGPLRRGFVLGLLGGLAAGLLLLVAVSVAVAATHAQKIMPGVSINGVPVGGLDRAAATARLEAELPALDRGDVSLVVDSNAVVVPFAEMGRAYQLDAMLDAAFGVARSGNPVTDGIARLQALGRTSSVAPEVAAADVAALNAVVADLVARFSVEPVDASVAYDPEAGFTVTPAVVGASLDADAVRDELRSLMSSASTGDASIILSTDALAPAVSTRDARAAAIRARWMSGTPLALTGGGLTFELTAANLAAAVRFGAGSDGYAASMDREAVTALLEPLAAKVKSEPKNATYTWGPNGITGVAPGAPGRELDVPSSVNAVVEALETRASGSTLPSAGLAVATTQPPLSTEAATAAMAKMTRIGTWTTYYVPGEANYWNANIHIPAWDLDELVVAPGEWFEFWQDIGPVTLARGYGYGGVILNGRSVPNGALAGGICSTSTTLFNAAMRAGLEIGERTNHSYYIERYPLGLDATVLKTDTYETDMTFRNDTANPIAIRSYTGNGWVRFDIWGVADGRTVSLSAPITSNHGVARDTVVVNPNLAPGTSKRVEYPHNGFHSVVTRTVRDASGNVIWTNVWQSNYRTVNGITEVGPRAAPPAPASTTAPTPTPAP